VKEERVLTLHEALKPGLENASTDFFERLLFTFNLPLKAQLID
jgi:hypothetical protein